MKEVKVKDRQTKEYTEGKRAFGHGVVEDACPYPIGNSRRMCWYLGYFDARIKQNTGIDLKKEKL